MHKPIKIISLLNGVQEFALFLMIVAKRAHYQMTGTHGKARAGSSNKIMQRFYVENPKNVLLGAIYVSYNCPYAHVNPELDKH